MREDMAKVIVERPRLGGGYPYPRARARNSRQRDAEDLPRRQGIRRPWTERGNDKGLNENLSPLRRFLRSNVGRPWDKVFSEICEHLNINSAVQLHIWQHLQWEVCLHPVRQGRGWVCQDDWRRCKPFVVDPRNGLLRENQDYLQRWKRPREKKESLDVISVDAGRCYRRIDGIWYELLLAPIPADLAGIVDVVFRQHVQNLNRSRLATIHGGDVYAFKKRQLNSKEIRRLPKLSGHGPQEDS